MHARGKQKTKSLPERDNPQPSSDSAGSRRRWDLQLLILGAAVTLSAQSAYDFLKAALTRSEIKGRWAVAYEQRHEYSSGDTLFTGLLRMDQLVGCIMPSLLHGLVPGPPQQRTTRLSLALRLYNESNKPIPNIRVAVLVRGIGFTATTLHSPNISLRPIEVVEVTNTSTFSLVIESLAGRSHALAKVTLDFDSLRVSGVPSLQLLGMTADGLTAGDVSLREASVWSADSAEFETFGSTWTKTSPVQLGKSGMKTHLFGKYIEKDLRNPNTPPCGWAPGDPPWAAKRFAQPLNPTFEPMVVEEIDTLGRRRVTPASPPAPVPP